MNQPDNILQELRELSSVVAGINRVNVFTVPENYFESLSGLLLLRASAGNVLKTSEAAMPDVPQGYFENLAGNILQRIKNGVSEETLAISTLVAGIGRQNIYAVPAGYFQDLSNQILAGIDSSRENVGMETAAISGLVANIGNKNVYSVADGYFNQLPESLVTQLNLSSEVYKETAEQSALVAGIDKVNVYSVPQGYFENLSTEVLQQLTPTAKVISMKSRFTAFRYAAAAVVTGIIAVSAFFMLNKNDNTQARAQVAVMVAANNIIKTNSFDAEMNNISDAAIVAFLENKGQNVEASLVASLVDDKDLPEPVDYLLNENTLDDMLNSLDLNN